MHLKKTLLYFEGAAFSPYFIFIILSITFTFWIYSGYQFYYQIDTFLAVNPSSFFQNAYYSWTYIIAPGMPWYTGTQWSYYLFNQILLFLRVGYGAIQFSYFVFLLFSTMSSLYFMVSHLFNADTSRKRMMFVLLSIAYAINVYALSINWFDVEAWNGLSIIAPATILLVSDSVGNKLRVKTLGFFLMVGSIFSYGITGPYFIATLMIILLFPIFYDFLSGSAKNIPKHVTYNLGIVSLVGFLNLVVLLTPSAFVSSSFASQPNLYEFMFGESASTSLLHVFSQTGYGWLLAATNDYPWYSNLLIQHMAIIIDLILFGGAITYTVILKKSDKLVITTVLCLLIVTFLIKGVQPPFGTIEYYAVRTGFYPFLIFVNPYYLIGPYFEVLLYLLLATILIDFLKADKITNDQPYFVFRYKRIEKTLTLKKFAAFLIVAILIASVVFSLYVLYSGMAEPSPKQGTYVTNLFDLPHPFYLLSKVLNNPNYSVFEYPIEDGILRMYNFNGTILQEDGHLSLQFIKMPVYTVNNTKITYYLSELLSTNLTEFSNVAEFFNVKYVLINGYTGGFLYSWFNLKETVDRLSNSSYFSLVKKEGLFYIYQMTKVPYPRIYTANVSVAANNLNVDIFRNYTSDISTDRILFLSTAYENIYKEYLHNGPNKSSVSLSFSVISPVKYSLSIRTSNEVVALVLGQSYSPQWILSSKSALNIIHVPGNFNYSNVYFIVSKSAGTGIHALLTVYFIGNNTNSRALLISGAIAMGGAGIMLVDVFRHYQYLRRR